MNIRLEITCVDGETYHVTRVTDPEEGLKFLERHDHEGSSVNMDIECEDAEDIYRALNALRNAPSQMELTLEKKHD